MVLSKKMFDFFHEGCKRVQKYQKLKIVLTPPPTIVSCLFQVFSQNLGNLAHLENSKKSWKKLPRQELNPGLLGGSRMT